MNSRRLAAMATMLMCGALITQTHVADNAFADGNEKPAETKESPMKAKIIHYSGMVQGVGFRATVAALARDHPVTGWVKNRPDGRVEMLVEGSDEAIGKFLAAVRSRWKENIEKEQIEERAASGKFKGFEIAR